MSTQAGAVRNPAEGANFFQPGAGGFVNFNFQVGIGQQRPQQINAQQFMANAQVRPPQGQQVPMMLPQMLPNGAPRMPFMFPQQFVGGMPWPFMPPPPQMFPQQGIVGQLPQQGAQPPFTQTTDNSQQSSQETNQPQLSTSSSATTTNAEQPTTSAGQPQQQTIVSFK